MYSKPIVFEGIVSKGRFGVSAVKLGDIDNDGYEGERIKHFCGTIHNIEIVSILLIIIIHINHMNGSICG